MAAAAVQRNTSYPKSKSSPAAAAAATGRVAPLTPAESAQRLRHIIETCVKRAAQLTCEEAQGLLDDTKALCQTYTSASAGMAAFDHSAAWMPVLAANFNALLTYPQLLNTILDHNVDLDSMMLDNKECRIAVFRLNKRKRARRWVTKHVMLNSITIEAANALVQEALDNGGTEAAQGVIAALGSIEVPEAVRNCIVATSAPCV